MDAILGAIIGVLIVNYVIALPFSKYCDEKDRWKYLIPLYGFYKLLTMEE